ncbi:acyltransferase family protein [Cryobacterium sp. SO2]|uniref:acyltransferase family protein n=1 Tax=Cryobacterium sp. SO2 TaxID=1897060 RepID=UPI00223E349E|nr:acyltransferase family protein [Cryobacterium sp. SO2]WEO78959.1 acyltransferase family protein [Cryobacterium sp. SO2]
MSPVPGAPAPARSARRPDIQGLRALAVIAVICNHVIPWPAGGFAGVDIFFVISGFLITGILLREHERTGRISLRTFYTNRLRRILPSAAVVLAVTGALGYVLFNQTRAIATLWDSLAALLFAANWRFTTVGTDYFHATAPASAVQHFWSLAVEEQFYLVWPWLLILVLTAVATGSRTTGRGRRAIAMLAGLVVVASFGYAVWETTTNPTVAYFSTFSRAWELGIGALLAVAAPLMARIPVAVRFLLGWGGLTGIIGSFFVLGPDLPFPGPWAALPVLATALVIISGTGAPQRHLFPLTNPVSVYLGNISYSLYLWHFPVFIFLTLFLPDQTLQTTLLIFGATAATAIVAYYLIEQPVHRSPWLRGAGRPAAERQQAWQSWRDRFSTQFIMSSLGAFVIVAVVAVSFQLHERPLTPINAPVADAQSDADPELQLQADLAAAAAATAWPNNLMPTLNSAMNTTSNNNPARDCFGTGDTPSFDKCTWGDDDAPNQMFLVGDSEALSYAPAFKAIAEASDGEWKITTIGLYGCRFTEVLIANEDPDVMSACPQRKADVAAEIVSTAPQLVVVANAFAEGQDTANTPLSVADIVASAFAETAGYDAAGKIVYLAAPPLGAELGQCYSNVSSPQNCNVGIGPTWLEFASAFSAESATGDHFVTSLPFSCADGICPAFAGTIPTKYDSVHMTPAYAEHVAPAIRYALVGLGLM